MDFLEAGLKAGERETETLRTRLCLCIWTKRLLEKRIKLWAQGVFLSTMNTDNRSGVILRKCTPPAAQALGVALGGGPFGIRET